MSSKKPNRRVQPSHVTSRDGAAPAADELAESLSRFHDACWPKRGFYVKGFSKHLRKHDITRGPVWDALHEAHRRYRIARVASEPEA